jgi:hypothetical protein
MTDPREEEFLKHVPTAFSPADPYPCGSCSIVTGRRADGRNHVTHIETCAECRAAGAPETLPWS